MMFEVVEPSVELMGATFMAYSGVDLKGEYITPSYGCEQLIEEAGRVCYRSEDRITSTSYKGFIERIMNRGHLSVLEHAHVTLSFITDRGVTHEMVRHRVASYSQESTRYCKYNDGPIKVIKPPDLSAYGEKVWAHSVTEAAIAYNDLLANGCKAEIARSVLPNCLATKIVMTCNLREWLHVLDLRTSKFAHPQIREVMGQAEKILLRVAPTIFSRGTN
jgi:thymidylate synthase (FAD)